MRVTVTVLFYPCLQFNYAIIELKYLNLQFRLFFNLLGYILMHNSCHLTRSFTRLLILILTLLAH